MLTFTRERWLSIGKFVRAVGFVGCAFVFLWQTGLEVYYSASRPHSPQPEHGWTVPLQWTHTSYGTLQENQHLLKLFDSFFWFFAVPAAGVAILQFYEKYEPWRARR